MHAADAPAEQPDGPSVRAATCLGCGCLCDDIDVETDGRRITRLVRACPLGERWFGDGTLPDEVRIDGRAVPLDEAVQAAADLLFAEPERLLVYVADDLMADAHREAVALADRLGASVDGPTSDTVAGGLLAAQRRGRASATLGELRHRADLVVFWGVDPTERYPRFRERFVDAPATLVPSRRLVAVDIGPDRGPADCGERLALDPADEVDALGVMRAVVRGRAFAELSPPLAAAADLARRMTEARYVGLIHDAEPGPSDRDPDFAEALIALVQALNTPTRAALVGLRAGGNRNGFESLLTWQTGYPFAVDFATGTPAYVADEPASARLARGRYAAALVLGSAASIPPPVAEELGHVPTAAIGPRASEASFAPRAAIDTGAASLHDGGMVLRMDDLPIETVPVLAHPRSVAEVLRRLAASVPTAAGVR